MNRVYFKVEEEDGEGLLREFLRFKRHISDKGLCKLKDKGQILWNDQPVTVRQWVKPGDQVTLVYPEEQVSEYLEPEAIPLDIVFEDEDLIVLNKPPGICVHPTKGYPSGTLANGVMAHCLKQGQSIGCHIVTRLDMDTSGLVLMAKNTFAKQQLYLQQEEKAITRRYLALVEGQITENEGTIDAPIARKEGRTIARLVAEHGQTAITHYRVIMGRAEASLVELVLETGRTHQIRVHMAHIGHPLLGDKLYGGQQDEISRQALHATALRFIHPRTKAAVVLSIPLPSDMSKLLDKLAEKGKG